jgi:hypothetical protein
MNPTCAMFVESVSSAIILVAEQGIKPYQNRYIGKAYLFITPVLPSVIRCQLRTEKRKCNCFRVEMMQTPIRILPETDMLAKLYG